MKKLVICVAVVALIGLAAGLRAEETTTLNGTYVWEQRDNSGDLEAIFTPAGEGAWDVAFNFEFRGKAHTYSGTAKGSLTEGNLSGRVLNEGEKRTFTFEGTTEDGVFTGKHAELHGDESVETGTLTLQ